MVENKYQIRIIFYKLYGMSIHPKRKTKGKKKKKNHYNEYDEASVIW